MEIAAPGWLRRPLLHEPSWRDVRSDLILAAVDVYLGSGDEGARVGGEEKDGAGDLVGPSHPAQRNPAGLVCPQVMQGLTCLGRHGLDAGVSIGPGATVLTRMPRPRSSLAQVRANERTAAFDAA